MQARLAGYMSVEVATVAIRRRGAKYARRLDQPRSRTSHAGMSSVVGSRRRPGCSAPSIWSGQRRRGPRSRSGERARMRAGRAAGQARRRPHGRRRDLHQRRGGQRLSVTRSRQPGAGCRPSIAKHGPDVDLTRLGLFGILGVMSEENVEIVLALQPDRAVDLVALFRDRERWAQAFLSMASRFHTDFEVVFRGLLGGTHTGADGMRASGLAGLAGPVGLLSGRDRAGDRLREPRPGPRPRFRTPRGQHRGGQSRSRGHR
jgi:hypothetical protein